MLRNMTELAPEESLINPEDERVDALSDAFLAAGGDNEAVTGDERGGIDAKDDQSSRCGIDRGIAEDGFDGGE